MSIGAIFLGFLLSLTYCVGVVLVAFAVVWALKVVAEITVDDKVMKYGKIFVALICIYIMAVWLFGVIGGVNIGPFPRLR